MDVLWRLLRHVWLFYMHFLLNPFLFPFCCCSHATNMSKASITPSKSKSELVITWISQINGIDLVCHHHCSGKVFIVFKHICPAFLGKCLPLWESEIFWGIFSIRSDARSTWSTQTRCSVSWSRLLIKNSSGIFYFIYFFYSCSMIPNIHNAVLAIIITLQLFRVYVSSECLNWGSAWITVYTRFYKEKNTLTQAYSAEKVEQWVRFM